MSTHRTRHRIAATGSIALLGLLGAGCRIVPGTTYEGDGTYYGGSPAEGACSFDDATGWQYAAMNHLDYEGARACGAFVKVTGPDGTVTVRIVDECPECAAGDIDLSPTAFDAIADPIDGRVPVSWVLESPSSIGTIGLHVKDGSSQWWLAIQVRNHRNIIEKLEIDDAGTWVQLPRTSYNYFVAEAGMGPGPFTVRITDVHGEQLVLGGVQLQPGVVQDTGQQLIDR